MKFKIFIITILLFMTGCDSDKVVKIDTSETELSSDSDLDPTPKPEPKQKIPNWYMKTVVNMTLADGTNYECKKGGVFGELQDSNNGKDRYDVLAFGTAKLRVVFSQTEWGEYDGDYVSNYQSLKEDGEKRVWTFQVKNQRDLNLTNAQLKLSLDGPYDVDFVTKDGYTSFKETLATDTSKKTSIMLVDVDNQTEYSYAQLQTANLTMGGLKIRTFRWVLGTVDSSDYTMVNAASSKMASPSVTNRSVKIDTIPNPNDKFGLPPSE